MVAIGRVGRQEERKVKGLIFSHSLPALTCVAVSFQKSLHDPGLLVHVLPYSLLYYLGVDSGHQ